MLLVILMMGLIFCINGYKLIHKLQSFVKLWSTFRTITKNWISFNEKMDLNHCLKSILIPLGLTAAAAATYATIHKKMFGSCMITLFLMKK